MLAQKFAERPLSRQRLHDANLYLGVMDFLELTHQIRRSVPAHHSNCHHPALEQNGHD
jgi:hypothetical protein